MHHVDVYVARGPHQLKHFWVLGNKCIDIMWIVTRHIEDITWPMTGVSCAFCLVSISPIDHKQRITQVR